MSTLDAASLLSDPAPIWLDHPALPPTALLAGAGLAPLALPQAAPDDDPLAQALPWLVRHLGVAAALEAVMGPVDDGGGTASDRILPALRRIGFDARIARRPLVSLAVGDLPAVLLLRSGDACVLTARLRGAQGQALCHVVLPGPQPDEFSTAEAEIEAEYSGVALLVSARGAHSPALPDPAPAAGPGQTQALAVLAAALQTATRAMNAAEREAPVLPALPIPAAPGVAAAAIPQTPPATLSPEVDSDDGTVLDLSFLRPAAPRRPTGQVVHQALLAGLGVSKRWLHRLGLAARRAVLLGTQQALPQATRLGQGVVLALRRGLAGLRARLVPLRQALRRHRPAQNRLPAQRAGTSTHAMRAASPGAWLRGAAAGSQRRWRASLAAGAHTRIGGLSGLAGGWSLCLLIGAPLAWARMVSASSVQAVQVAPGLLRHAFAADQDHAIAALASRPRPAALGQAKRQDSQDGPDGPLPALPLVMAAGQARRGALPLAQQPLALQPLAPLPASRPLHRMSGPAGLVNRMGVATPSRGLPRRARHIGR